MGYCLFLQENFVLLDVAGLLKSTGLEFLTSEMCRKDGKTDSDSNFTNYRPSKKPAVRQECIFGYLLMCPRWEHAIFAAKL